jgi:hypothetical protein
MGSIDLHIQNSVNARYLFKIIEAMQLLKSNTSIVAVAFINDGCSPIPLWRHRLTDVMLR